MLRIAIRKRHIIRPCCSHNVSSRRHNSAVAAQLGLRSRRPPDSIDPGPDSESPSKAPKPNQKHEPEEKIPDEEWELRTGRAIYVLQRTLPDFFNSGLVSWHKDDVKSWSLLSKLPLSGISKGDDEESIYSPNVRLMYTPPTRLPAPFPQTFRIEGLPLYMASSVFIRHTMKTFYSDLEVSLTKCTVNTPPHSKTNPGKKRLNREKSVTIAVSVLGSSRVSGATGQWDVTSTYKFSPISGLILTHTVNEIHPAPHLTAYEGLRSLLGFHGYLSERSLASHERAQAIKEEST